MDCSKNWPRPFARPGAECFAHSFMKPSLTQKERRLFEEYGLQSLREN